MHSLLYLAYTSGFELYAPALEETLTASDIIEDDCHDSSEAVIRISSALLLAAKFCSRTSTLLAIAVMDAVANAVVDGRGRCR